MSQQNYKTKIFKVGKRVRCLFIYFFLLESNLQIVCDLWSLLFIHPLFVCENKNQGKESSLGR